MFITLKRIIRSGFKLFWRNSLLSASSILVITIALTITLATFFSNILLKEVVNHVEKKVDIHIYFKKDAPEAKILELTKLINVLSEVKAEETEYIPKEEVLKSFKEKHINDTDSSVLEALKLLGDNPLGAVLNIKAKKIGEYSKINTFLTSKNVTEKFGEIIDEISFNKNKKVINTLNRLIDYSYLIGSVASLILILISIIITFNTVRLTIYTLKEEVVIMRLVGASRFFARGPFIIEGIIYGFISSLFALFISWGIIYKASNILEGVFYLNLNTFFSDNLLQITGALVVGGISLGFLSTYLAISKYLKV